MDSPEVDDGVPHNKLREVLLQKAHELFVICDKERKGYITKTDMQNLRGELPLTPEQLTEVFDALDDDHNGRLTLDEFTDGFGMFLRIDTRRRRLSRSWEDEPGTLLLQEVESPIPEEGQEEFNNLLNQLGAQNVFEDEDYIREVWEHLRKDDPNVLNNFEHFLGKVTTDLLSSRNDYSKLESTLKSRSNQHDEQVQQLYLEMEDQLKSANEQMLAKEKSLEKKVREELEAELQQKDEHLQDLLAQHSQMEKRLNQLNSGEVETKHENLKLQKEKETLERQLLDSEKSLTSLRQYIDSIQKQSLEERKRRAKAALKVSEGIALEREGLVKQLDLLRTVNRKLLDEKDEINSSSPTPIRRSNHAAEVLVNCQPIRQQQDTATQGSEWTGTCSFPQTTQLSSPQELQCSGETAPRTGSKAEDDCEVDDQFFQAGGYDASPTTSPNNFNFPPHPAGMRKVRNATARRSRGSEDGDDVEVDDQFFQVMGQACPLVTPQNNFNLSATKEVNTHAAVSISDDENAEPAVLKTGCVYADSVKAAKPPHRPIHQQYPVDLNTTQPYRENKEPKKKNSIINPERLFKIVLIGDSGVGKTSFIHRFCNETFRATFSATVGVDFQVKSACVDGRLVALQLWDTAGQERFRSITKQYFRKADGIIIVYDVTSEISFKNVRNWISSVKEAADERVVLMLVGNKTDLCESDDDRVVKTKDGNWLADEFGSLFYETSAKTGNFVTEAMAGIASLLQEREDEEIERALQLQAADMKRRKCC